MSDKMRDSDLSVSVNHSHHQFSNGEPAYKERFKFVWKFKFGLAPVLDNMNQAYHIQYDGTPAYSKRYLEAFGYYCSLASVRSKEGCFHITLSGEKIYEEIYFLT